MSSGLPACERARLWVSLSADGEISQLELAFLRDHLARCSDCAAFAAVTGEVVRTLRSAPLEDGPAVVFSRRTGPVARISRLQLAASAAAVLVAVLVGGLAGSLNSPHGLGAASAASVARTQQPYVEQRLLSIYSREPVIVHGRQRAL
jgi:predicted anti-sigma-YlaC factor YlaD